MAGTREREWANRAVTATWRAGVVVLWLASPSLARADGYAHSANPAGPAPKPAQETLAPGPSGPGPGPAAGNSDDGPQMATYYDQAAEVYMHAAVACAPRAACYNANAQYYRCLQQSLKTGSKGGCSGPPTCSTTSPPCTGAGTVQTGPATAGGVGSQTTVGQALSSGLGNLASTILSIQAEQAAREQAARDEDERVDAIRAGLLPKWRFFQRRHQEIEKDPAWQNTDFQQSPEGRACGTPCIGAMVDYLVHRYSAENVIDRGLTTETAKDDAAETRKEEALLAAWDQYKLRGKLEAAERQVRDALRVTKRHEVAPTVIAEGLRGPTMAQPRGAPMWFHREGDTVALSRIENGAVVTSSGRAHVTSSGLTVDGDSAFWTDGASVYRARLDLAAPTAIARSPKTFMVKPYGDRVYVMVYDDKSLGTLFSVPKDGGERTTHVQPTPAATLVAVGPLGLDWYWSDYERNLKTFTSQPLGGGQAIVKHDQEILIVDQTPSARYYSLHTAALKLPYQLYEEKPGQAPTLLAQDLQMVWQLTVEGDWLYWLESDLNEALTGMLPGTLKRRSLKDGSVTVLADDIKGGGTFTVSDGALYFTSAGTVHFDGPAPVYDADGKVFRLELPTAAPVAAPSQPDSAPAAPASAAKAKAPKASAVRAKAH